ncbi:hypothetical protein ABZ614_07635 [Streptomyces sp. NPDC013178]|uniref:hypothetical protein n=1 Tax=Streptomyces sp. NPDC013178 TaxID=3155118 RepID=UPI0033CFF301
MARPSRSTDFALALLIGLAVGTYSSMFTATPLAIELHKTHIVARPVLIASPPGA